jgi:hypothetical protein
MPWQGDPRSAQEVADALQRVLARSEFDHSKGLLEEVLDWIVERLGSLDVAGSASASRVLLIALAVVLALALLAALARALKRRARRPRPAVQRQAAVRTRVAELRAAARAARARGDDALALRYLLFALVAGLGQRGDLRFRDAWTNRELVRRGEPSREARALLAPLIDELEAKEFGGAPVTPADVDRLEELCARWLGLEEAA